MKLPVDEFGDLDPTKLTIAQNHARLAPMVKALTASLNADLSEAAMDTLREIEKTCRAMWMKLHNDRLAIREKRNAVTLARKDPA